MKKIISLLIITCAVILTGCADPYNGKRPVDYGEAIWICEETDMYFEVGPEYSIPLYGKLIRDGQELDIEVWFMDVDLTSIEVIYNDGEFRVNSELWGRSEFYPDKVIIHVNEDSHPDSIFYGKYEKLTFIRTEKQDSNTID